MMLTDYAHFVRTCCKLQLFASQHGKQQNTQNKTNRTKLKSPLEQLQWQVSTKLPRSGNKSHVRRGVVAAEEPSLQRLVAGHQSRGEAAAARVQGPLGVRSVRSLGESCAFRVRFGAVWGGKTVAEAGHLKPKEPFGVPLTLSWCLLVGASQLVTHGFQRVGFHLRGK